MEKGTVIHGNIETLPSISRQLKDVRCCDGDSVTLECHVTGVPEPIIIWEKDGRVLTMQNDFLTTYDGSRATLAIQRIYPEDEGEYTCVASNSVGRAYSTACIIVDVPEEKENFLSTQLARPPGFLSAHSTPRSTPRTTPIRSISPLTLSYRNTSIDITPKKRKFAAPKFLAIPHNKIVEEGETVRFQCAVSGHPIWWSTWDKNGTVVSPSARITIKERDDLRLLEIEEVTYEDAGLYRITVENDYGRIEATARLDVIRGRRSTSRPIRTYSASPRRHLYTSRRLMGYPSSISGRLALSCTLRGSSVPARKFYHNGTELVEDSRTKIRLTETEATLTIDNVEEADQGDYTCIAQNDYETISTSTCVTIYSTPDNIIVESPRIAKPLDESVKIIESLTTDLVFNVHCIEPFTYRWFKDGEELLETDEFLYIDHGDGWLALRIMDPFDIDSGIYSCTVETANGRCHTSTHVMVEEDPNSNRTSDSIDILKHPLPIMAFLGDVISFGAKIYPEDAAVAWTVCGREVRQDSREFSLETQSNGIRILHVLGVEYQHSGEVTLSVYIPSCRNQIVRSYTDLVVLPSIRWTLFDLDENKAPNNDIPDISAYIIQPPNDVTGLIGGTIFLEALFGGNPTPTVKWMKAGRSIVESANIRITVKSDRSTLIITSVTGDDSGKYTIEVMNSYGSDLAAASVAIEGPPEPPSGKPSVSQGPDRVAIAWCGPPYDGGCVLSGFILEMKEGDDDWKEVVTVVDSLAYTVKNLNPGSSYRFRVRAENIHGHSEPSLPSDEIIASSRHSTNEDNTELLPNIDTGGSFKSSFNVLEELGRGRYGTVYKVSEKKTNQIMAAKIIKCIKSRDKEKVQDEISIMKSLQHPKLLQLAAVFDSPREMVMVMEYITGGELFERVVADDFTLTEHDCILFLRQICEGVSYMHRKSVVHLDLKPENIMCRTRSCHQIKIIDFGLAQRLSDKMSMRVLFGTPEFIAPEIINYEPIGFQTDMWSVGVICYVLLSGLSPFMGDSDVDTFANITRASYDFDDDAFDAVSQDAKDFISNLLIHRKEDRLTADECLESKWLTQHNEENLNVKICTDKLKKFIIRRKWQKTGNAIRALGRMATLSASRRNSATSGSLPNSPRPSISTGSGFSFSPNSGRMSSLNEEADDIDEILPICDNASPANLQKTNLRDKRLCAERSDSGFSDVSSCSAGSRVQSMQTHIFDKVPVIREELECNNNLTNSVVQDVLKMKLEEIVKHRELDETNNNDNRMPYSKAPDTSSTVASSDLLENFTIEVPREPIQKYSTCFDVKTKDPVLKSDFTNTVRMRKKSLENNMAKDKVVPKRPIFETSGKVSKLKSRFMRPDESLGKSSGVSTRPIAKSDTNSKSMDWKMYKSTNVFERLTAYDKNKAANKATQQMVSNSLPSSPAPSRKAMRLTGTTTASYTEVTGTISNRSRKFTNDGNPTILLSAKCPVKEVLTKHVTNTAQTNNRHRKQ